jgi:hypothetical protein
MEVQNYSCFHGMVHPPGKPDSWHVINETDDMTQDELDGLDLRQYPITEGHPPEDENGNPSSITKHPELVRGQVLYQYKNPDGSKGIVCQLNHDRLSGVRTAVRIQNGNRASLSLGHRYQKWEDADGRVRHRFVPDHIAIVDEPRREGCYIKGMARMDRIDNEANRKRIADFMGKFGSTRDIYVNASKDSRVPDSNPNLKMADTASAPAAAAAQTPSQAPAPAQAQAQSQTQSQNPGPDSMDLSNLNKDEAIALFYRAVQDAKAANDARSALEAENSKYKSMEEKRKQAEIAEKKKQLEERLTIIREHAMQLAEKDAQSKRIAENIADPKKMCDDIYGCGMDEKVVNDFVENSMKFVEVLNNAASTYKDGMARNERTMQEYNLKRFREDPALGPYAMRYMSEEPSTKRMAMSGFRADDPPAAASAPMQAPAPAPTPSFNTLDAICSATAARVSAMRGSTGSGLDAYYEKAKNSVKPVETSPFPKGYTPTQGTFGYR